MESKEAALNPTAEVIPGSNASSPSPSIINDVVLSKTIASNENNDDKSRDNSTAVVSEDEDYVSGNEEFEASIDKAVLNKIDGSDVPGMVENGGGGVEEGDKVVERDGDVVGKDFGDGVGADGGSGRETGVEGIDDIGELADSVGELGVNSDGVAGEVVDGERGKAVVEGVEADGEGEAGKGREPEVKEGCEVAVEQVELESMPEGDSVVKTIQVDVAGPGVAVVGEPERNKDVLMSKIEEKEVAEVDVVDDGDVSLTKKEDSVVDESEVDVPSSGASIGVIKENGANSNELEQEEVAEVALTAEGDAVVDTIKVNVNVVDPGVAVVGGTKEIGDGEELPLESVCSATENGDGVEKDVDTREIGVDLLNSEQAAEDTVGNEKDKTLDAGAVAHLENGFQTPEASTDSFSSSSHLDNCNSAKVHIDGEVKIAHEMVESDTGIVRTNDAQTGVDGISEELAQVESNEPKAVTDDLREIREVEDEMDVVNHEEPMSCEDTDGMVFGSSEAAKKFIEDLERESGGDSHTGLDSSLEQSQRIDGQIVTDSEEEGETDDEGDGKELFDSTALAALLKAATGADSGGGNITFTSQEGSKLFSMERPAGLGSSLQSLRPAPRQNRSSLFGSLAPAGGGEVEENLSEEEKKKLEKLQEIRVKFLRLVHRLGLTPEESVAAQVLYRLALLGGRQGTHTFSLDAAKRTALQLETGEKDDLDFSINILVLGKSGVGKSATINSLFGEEKAPIDAFETGTAYVREMSGSVDGVEVRVVDTPGLKSSVMEQGINRSTLSSIKKFTKKSSPDVVLYVDRLDAQSRDLNDLPMLKTVTSTLGSAIWRSAIVTLTHAASAPPDGPSGTPLSYEVFVSQRSHVVQQSIGHAVGDLRMMSPSLMNPVSLVENHPSCRKNRDGQNILPNGQSWRPQLLLLCYSMKILSEASAISKPQDPFDHRKLFGFRSRPPPLPYMLSSMLQSRQHPKLPSDQGGDSVDSDIDLDDFSDSDQEEEDEYDQLPPFRPLRKAQIAKLSREQKKAYFEEFDYRVKLLQKKQWREELKRMRETKKRGKDAAVEYGFAEDDAEGGAAAPVAVPLPDMALPPSFDGDNPAFRYRFLEPTSQFLARPVLDSHGWDHDCGYDGVNLEHSLAIANRLAAAYTVQITKDKKDFSISLDSSVAAKLGENTSSMAGFDIQSIGKQLAYIVRAETKTKSLKKHKATGGLSLTFLGENMVPGVKIEDQITFGQQYALVGSAGAVRSQHDTAYGANFELQRRELDYPIGQVQSNLSMSIIKWRGDLALGLNSLVQFSIGRNSKVAVRAGINNKLSGQITVRTSSSDHLSLALAAVIPAALSIYKKLYPEVSGDKYSIY
ncbi:translocase of chloroplast 159, chloroplastic-like [Salvia splendens]|uniref:translocase of chloroplast 159, chloroplastic-like n=1 Tax=Salvia splendens TaxID=180675 RepID=UPI001C269FBE|nr:translocase of chloroplast 159, chloroplastic-like [Salvia splendens]